MKNDTKHAITKSHRFVADKIRRVIDGECRKVEDATGIPVKSTHTGLEELLARHLPDRSAEIATLHRQRDALLAAAKEALADLEFVNETLVNPFTVTPNMLRAAIAECPGGEHDPD